MIESTDSPAAGLFALLAMLLLVLAVEDANLAAAFAGGALVVAAVASLRPLLAHRRSRRSMRPRTLYRAPHGQATRARQTP